MKEETLILATYHADEFLARVSELTKVMTKKPYWKITGCKESAAVTRASMELTRILAKLRQNE